jgi:Tol biopolymer transport system component
VAFASTASNLVSGDTNKKFDVFVRDVQTGSTARVSVKSGNEQSSGDSLTPAISGDGRYIVFASSAANLVTGDTNAKSDVFIHDRQTGTTSRVSLADGGAQATGDSLLPAISSDGEWISFVSTASNIVTGDTNGMTDVFVKSAP